MPIISIMFMPIAAYGYDDSNFNPIVTPIFLLAEFLSCSAYKCKGGFVPDQLCQCNLACQEFGACCPDFFPVCLPGKNCYHKLHVCISVSYKLYYSVMSQMVGLILLSSRCFVKHQCPSRVLHST